MTHQNSVFVTILLRYVGNSDNCRHHVLMSAITPRTRSSMIFKRTTGGPPKIKLRNSDWRRHTSCSRFAWTHSPERKQIIRINFSLISQIPVIDSSLIFCRYSEPIKHNLSNGPPRTCITTHQHEVSQQPIH